MFRQKISLRDIISSVTHTHTHTHCLWLCLVNSSPRDCYLLPALKQNLGGHKFKVDREVPRVVTSCSVSQDTDWHRQEQKRSPSTRWMPLLMRGLCKAAGQQSTDIRTILITNFYRSTMHFDIDEVHSSTNSTLWNLKSFKFTVDKKNQLDVTFGILYFSSNSCSTCFGQPCAAAHTSTRL